jgi:hypothetical protein
MVAVGNNLGKNDKRRRIYTEAKLCAKCSLKKIVYRCLNIL